MKKTLFKTNEATANTCGAMESRDHFKNGASTINRIRKKAIFVLLAAVFTANVASAQSITVAGHEVVLGVRAGLNFSNWIADNEAGKFKSGIQIGAMANIILNDISSLQSGLLFSQMGCLEKDYGETYKINLNYFQIPINALYKLGDNFWMQGGLYLGFGLGVKTTINSGGVNMSTSTSFDEAGLKSFDFGAGAGIIYPFGPVQAALNTQIGITNITDSFRVKNIGFALTVTYFFRQ